MVVSVKEILENIRVIHACFHNSEMRHHHTPLVAGNESEANHTASRLLEKTFREAVTSASAATL